MVLIADPHDTLILVRTTHQLAMVLPDTRVQLVDQPLVPLVRRRTGVKNGCGAARDVVTFLARLRPR